MKCHLQLFLIFVAVFHIISVKGQTEVKDNEGHVYGTVVVGNDIWMRHNLQTSQLNDGTAIPWIVDPEEWSKMKTPAYTWYDNIPTHANAYGAIYNWYAIETGRLCPTGWHVPTEVDWKYLINAFPYDSITRTYIGGQMKEASVRYWDAPNAGATNLTGFTAMPGGMRDKAGAFFKFHQKAYFWSATPANSSSIYYYVLSHDTQSLQRFMTNKNCGFSVRCVKDDDRDK